MTAKSRCANAVSLHSRGAQVLGAERAQEPKLDLVDERTARQGIEHIERLDILARTQLMDACSRKRYGQTAKLSSAVGE